MGKKGNGLGILYLIGMAVVAIGFCLPMFKIGPAEFTGLKFINFEKGTFVTIGACLIFFGAILGAVWALLPMIGIKLPSEDLIKLVALLASIAGGIVLVIGFQDNGIYKAIGKSLVKHATYGFYMVVAGWVAALVGKFVK